MLDSSSPNLLRVSGIKRLLPAFEPSSSPPRFKRSKSRAARVDNENRYPTPLPSSSLGLLPSSPPPSQSPQSPCPQCLPQSPPPVQQPQLAPTLSERAPLSAVPSITLPENGEPVFLGRSSKSSHYRLSNNKLISRVHIKARYINTTSPMIELLCIGWNGAKVHCQGKVWDLQKDDIFCSESENVDLLLDVHDSRVFITWPGKSCSSGASLPKNTDSSHAAPRITRSPSADDENIDPMERARRINARPKLTPVSPLRKRGYANSPITLPSESMTETFLEIYEDESEPEAEIGDKTQVQLPPALSDIPSSPVRDLDEEIEPITKNSVAFSFDSDPVLPPVPTCSTAEPLKDVMKTPPPSFRRRPRASTSPASSPQRPSESVSSHKSLTIQNHLTNQLAFSRINSIPLSELYRNLPLDLAATVTKDRVQSILSEIPCVGEIKRVGKDAAGKPLEHQYYYIPDADTDEVRKMAIGGRTGMRSCRKTHKQYFWKKPKKPSY